MSVIQERNERDIYDVPEQCAKRVKSNHGPWRPLNASQDTTPSAHTNCLTANDKSDEVDSRRQPGLIGHQQASHTKDITRALTSIEPEGMTTEEIIKWVCDYQVHQNEETDADKLEKGIRAALKQQFNRKKPKFWEYWDTRRHITVWKLLRLPVGVSQSSMAHRSPTAGHVSEGPVQSNEGVPPVDLTHAGATYNANAQNTRAESWRDKIDVIASQIPQVEMESRPLSNDSQPYNLAPGSSVPAETSRQYSRSHSQDSPIARSRQSHSTEIPVHHHNEHATVAGHQEAVSSLGDTDRATTDTINAINQEKRIEPDDLEILQLLRQNKQERIARKRKIEADRTALPDISALKTRVEDAEKRHAEQIRIAEEAERLVSAVGSELKDALAKERQIADDEKALEKLIETSTVLRVTLGIDD